MQEFLTNQNDYFIYKKPLLWLRNFLVFELILLIYLVIYIPKDDFVVNFFDIGQGDSIFIKTPENHQILIDTGPDNMVVERLLDSMSFFDSSLDMIILTHADLDHVGGILDVLKRYSVDTLLISGAYGGSPLYQKFLKEIRDKNLEEKIEIITPQSGQRFHFGEVYFDVLYPFGSVLGEKDIDINDNSIALQINFRGKKFLLCGDISIEIEKLLINKYGSKLKSLVFKANHHGSKYSNDISFIQIVAPESVVVSSGKDNKFMHPHVEVLMNFYRANVINIFRTDEMGSIKLRYK